MTEPRRAGILIVDDEPANLTALEAVLAPLNQEIMRANSGREALRHLLRQPFALILMDVKMPGMDGFETAELIRSRQANETTPIIFVTAFGQAEQDMLRGYRLGGVDFIFKPINAEMLQAKTGVFVQLFQNTEAITDLLLQAEAASVSKSDFLNMAAHELRTPLSVLHGYLSMLQDGTFGEPPPDWRRVLDVLNVKAGELNKIVDDLLTASRLETGTMGGSSSELDLVAVARGAIERAAARADMLQAELTLEAPPGPVLVHADTIQLARIADNLINNALTYAHGKPWVRVTVQGGEHALLAVEDRGIGIPQQMRERIFERFIRLNDPELAPQPGTGLGLYISRELAHRNRGSLLVISSEPGVGSTLALRLPTRPVSVKAAPVAV